MKATEFVINAMDKALIKDNENIQRELQNPGAKGFICYTFSIGGNYSGMYFSTVTNAIKGAYRYQMKATADGIKEHSLPNFQIFRFEMGRDDRGRAIRKNTTAIGLLSDNRIIGLSNDANKWSYTDATGRYVVRRGLLTREKVKTKTEVKMAGHKTEDGMSAYLLICILRTSPGKAKLTRKYLDARNDDDIRKKILGNGYMKRYTLVQVSKLDPNGKESYIGHMEGFSFGIVWQDRNNTESSVDPKTGKLTKKP